MSIPRGSLRILLLLLTLAASVPLSAQIQVVSPYSRYGIGDISENNNAWNLGMGELGIGIRNPQHVNYLNPASYTAFDSLSFVFEGGLTGQVTTLRSELKTATRSYGSLGSLLFGMPITRWWKTSLGLVPFSDVGYSVVNKEEMAGVGTVARYYGGSGGVSRLYWGNAFRPVHNLSIGVNVSYLFGSMERMAKVIFPDSAYAMNFKEFYYVTMSDIHYSFGAQYTVRLPKDISMTLGAVYAPTLSMSSRVDLLATTFLLTTSAVESPRDTLANATKIKGRISIPSMLGGGVSFSKPDNWTVGVDYNWQNWKQFDAFGMSDSLVNSWSVNVGGEIIPNADKYNNYMARIHYRLGFNYGRTYLHLRGQDLNAYSVTFGFGLPLRGMRTMLNLSGQYGGRGTTADGLIRESYFKLVIGFSIYERWFVKRKYY